MRARVCGLGVSFFRRPALRAVDLALPARGLVFVMGKSGVGKTTFLRALNRLNEEFPGCETSGEAWLDLGDGLENIYATAKSVTEIRRRVGMVFQTPAILPVSVRKNLVLPLRLAAGRRESEIDGLTEQALRAAKLWHEVADRLSAPASSLSAGQQQRLCLARALSLEPAVLLLDEPTASLDPSAAGAIEELLVELSRSRPLVVTSHNPDQAARLADHCLILVESGSHKVFARSEMPCGKDLSALLV